MSADPTQNILFETSPFGTLDGIVEHDGRVVYFYLNERPDPAGNQPGKFGTRACWVRNLARGPMVLNKAEMAEGKIPMMPRNDCVDAELHQVPQSESLEIVWFEEGNGAALIEVDRESNTRTTLAIIPPWSGVEDFHGYAANCAHETALAWPLPENKAMQLRIDRAAEFWNSFTSEGSPFASLQQQLVDAYNKQFGEQNQKQYYAIDGGKFPPRGLLRYETESATILVTVGMSLCSQPAVELYVDQPSDLRRVELGVKISRQASDANAELIDTAMQSISTFAAYPWRNHNWLGPGHTIDWSPSGSKATLVRDNELQLSSFRNDPIGLLWIDAENDARR
ncbi:suppressor of fused domain protein [Mariniblastus fucicola]|uniref:Suppressor of fused protein (SUFU) n=1 Tax=Mariniblastus fucicola TaxID=980251 RepID=A0A5B9PRT0_9BACT|nr:suppressor of fused domain protein [Mariniblastus fucicola]QEG25221.1 Suppressor of fused protein (SUFU) [Mariniblastus fucicola]